LREQLGFHALGQAQRVHQELEGQFIGRQQLLAGLEGFGRVQVVLGQAGLPGAQDAPVGNDSLPWAPAPMPMKSPKRQ
jgi:hypothetical protein